MEFLRFGSSIPGGYWGCCACCIIQNFKVDPDDKASIQLVTGDGGWPITDGSSNMLFAGPTYRDIFWQRIRSGTFDKRDMPNHAFLAILTENQIKGSVGAKWLAILKEAGFEFIRAVSNSVYTGQVIGESGDQARNYIFGLFRNIGLGNTRDQFTPPKEWRNLPSVKPEGWSDYEKGKGKALTGAQRDADKAIWDKIGPPKFLTEKEVVAAGAPVIMAGRRMPGGKPEEKSVREAGDKERAGKQPKTATANPWAKAA